jgi:hypothetical protein
LVDTVSDHPERSPVELLEQELTAELDQIGGQMRAETAAPDVDLPVVVRRSLGAIIEHVYRSRSIYQDAATGRSIQNSMCCSVNTSVTQCVNPSWHRCGRYPTSTVFAILERLASYVQRIPAGH